MIEQIAIAVALPRFKDLGRSVASTFLTRLFLQFSPRCPKMNKISIWEVQKNQKFCPRDKERITMIAKCELVR